MLRRLSAGQFFALLALALAVAVLASLAMGAISFSPAQMLHYLAQGTGLEPVTTADTLDRNIFLRLRLPRVVLCGLTGAILGVSGALMQGLFRNPIVEPGLAGTSAGAAFGAALVVVFGANPVVMTATRLGSFGIPVMAFLGGFAATLIVYALARSFGRVNVLVLLLAGIAVNALCNAGTGFLSYIARDPQARTIMFWNMGTFTTAEWKGTSLVAIAFAVAFALVWREGKALNALMLGEDEATYLGIDPDRLTWRLIVINTLMVAFATAMVGVIAFVGLVIPHALRIVRSSDYTFLLPASALLGAAVMEVIDLTARLIVAPAELPVGIITAVVGAPVFLLMLLADKRRTDNG